MHLSHPFPARSLSGQSVSLRTFPDGAGCALSRSLIRRVLLAIEPAIGDFSPCSEGGRPSAVLGHPAGLPPAGAELAAVDDAVVLVAGGAEHRGSAHHAIADLAIEKIADRAGF